MLLMDHLWQKSDNPWKEYGDLFIFNSNDKTKEKSPWDKVKITFTFTDKKEELTNDES
jgi:hypothetical protein